MNPPVRGRRQEGIAFEAALFALHYWFNGAVIYSCWAFGDVMRQN